MGRINQPQLPEFIYIWNVLDLIKRHLFDFFPLQQILIKVED